MDPMVTGTIKSNKSGLRAEASVTVFESERSTSWVFFSVLGARIVV